MDKKLFIQAIGKYLSGVALLFILLFAPAGTLKFWNMASDGNTLYSNVYCRLSFDV